VIVLRILCLCCDIESLGEVSKSGFPKSSFTSFQLGDRLLYSVNHLHYPRREVQIAPLGIDHLGSKLEYTTSCTSNANKSLSGVELEFHSIPCFIPAVLGSRSTN